MVDIIKGTFDITWFAWTVYMALGLALEWQRDDMIGKVRWFALLIGILGIAHLTLDALQ